MKRLSLFLVASAACSSAPSSDGGITPGLHGENVGDRVPSEGGVTSVPAQTPTDACSTGPAYESPASFAFAEDPTSYPPCTPRCDASPPKASWYEVDAVPSGACTNDGRICSIAAAYFCSHGDTIPSRVDSMKCTCTASEWSCVIAEQGGGLCVKDASPD